MSFDPVKSVKDITGFIQSAFKAQAFQKGIVAVSGGLDSAVSLVLAVNALGPDHLYTLQLPYKRQSLANSNLIINQFNIPFNQRLVFKLSRSVDKLAVKLNAKKDPLRFGNLLARARMICLFDQAKRYQALVIGTENKSERLLGYYTRYGDQASDLDPIGHLYKTQVISLAKHLKIPQPIIDQPPSAGLWPNQTDEQELGFSYQQADPVLELLVDRKLSPDQVVSQGHDRALVDKITRRLKSIDFKSRVPYHL
jgi:NAD+ synthase